MAWRERETMNQQHTRARFIVSRSPKTLSLRRPLGGGPVFLLEINLKRKPALATANAVVAVSSPDDSIRADAARVRVRPVDQPVPRDRRRSRNPLAQRVRCQQLERPPGLLPDGSDGRSGERRIYAVSYWFVRCASPRVW